MTPVDSFYAEQKSIERVGLGSWIQVYNDDGSDDWAEVRSVASYAHTESGRKLTEVHAITRGRELVVVREWNNHQVSVITRVKAKRAGLEAAT